MAGRTMECNASVAGRNVRYEIHDRFSVPEVDASTFCLDVGWPVIPETPYQRVLDLAVDLPVPRTIERESEHRNLTLHSRFGGGRTGSEPSR